MKTAWWVPGLGFVLGLLLSRHWIGGVLGAALAWLLASGLWRGALRSPSLPPAVVLFTLLGRLAKADGRVCEREIALCEQLMVRLALDDDTRRAAIEAFHAGKNPAHDLTPAYVVLRQLRAQAPLFLEVFVEMALADGRVDAAERQLLGKYAWMLGVREASLDALLQRRTGGTRGAGRGQSVTADPYVVLGLSRTAGDDEVRRAFRKLISQHHPDKLAASGAAPETVRLAQERSQQIIAAYEQIKSLRGMS